MTHLQVGLRPAQRTLCAGLLFLTAAAPLRSFNKQESATPTPTTTASVALTPSASPAPSFTPNASGTIVPTSPAATNTQAPTASAYATTITPSPSNTPVTPITATLIPVESPPPSSTPPAVTVTFTPPLYTLTATYTSAVSPTETPTDRGQSFPPLSVMISEVAWAGTLASAHDEWIELHNPGDRSIDLAGWRLSDGDDIQISLNGLIPAYGFFLLERSDDSTVANISADGIYTGSLNNSGERLVLLDPAGAIVDSANRDGGSWPAGDSSRHFSMERWGGDDQPGNWRSFPGTGGNGVDAGGNPIGGTPRQPNAIWFPQEPSPTPTSTPTPRRPDGTPYAPLSILINEVAWAGTMASSGDEWMELYNNTAGLIELDGWTLSDGQDIDIRLSGSIAARSYFLLERSNDMTISNIAADQIYSGSLRNSGERLTLQDPTRLMIDTADASTGWPAGDSGRRASMERIGGDDLPGNWRTYQSSLPTAYDAAGNPIAGSPRSINISLLPSPTPTPSPSPGTQAFPGDVLINEVAWSGTAHSFSDEYIELHNTTERALDVTGWSLRDGNDIAITLEGSIGAFGFYLLERTDDGCVRDIDADLIYSGNLHNAGETLVLSDGQGNRIDSANQGGGGWPAGRASSHASMERRGGEDLAGNWGTFTGFFGIGHDAGGGRIQGTPRGTNSLHFPTPEPTWIPGKIVINEVLIRPHYDWQGTGGVDTGDEFIELYNKGPGEVNLRGWILDDLADAGSAPFELPARTVAVGGFVAFFRSRTHIALNDSGDTVRLLNPAGKLIDSISYLRIRAANLSYGRLPDGTGHLTYGLWPTARRSNLLFVDALQNSAGKTPISCLDISPGTLRIPRLSRPSIRSIPAAAHFQIKCPFYKIPAPLAHTSDQGLLTRH